MTPEMTSDMRSSAKTFLPEGLSVRVRVPASSANLGPGFDCLGIALGMHDEMQVRTTSTGVVVDVSGEATDEVPRDGTHLVARAIGRGLEYAGAAASGLALECLNRIPHSRGLGSSAAAAVGGLAAASGLLAASGIRRPFSMAEMVQLSSEFEGHPDNAAASVLGAAVVTWIEQDVAVSGRPGGGAGRYAARRVEVHPDITATVFVPGFESSTAYTRSLLPDTVSRADAIFNTSRAALAVVALTNDPECLLAATDDRLHQGYRAPAMPATAALVAELRRRGHAATVSGAGPTVLVLSVGELPDDACEVGVAAGFAVQRVPIADGVDITW